MNPIYFSYQRRIQLGAVVLSMICFSAQSITALAMPLEPHGVSGYVGLPTTSDFQGRYRTVVGTKGIVVSDDSEASEWGAEILRRGGNAVDAAVATAFALSVTRPQFASLGGGGFFVFCPAANPYPQKSCKVIDYREVAPHRATQDMYIHNGQVNRTLAQDGALAIAVPGVPAGLLLMLEKYGTLSRQAVLSRPIKIALQGYRFTQGAEQSAKKRWPAMNKAAQQAFGCRISTDAVLAPCAPGTNIVQPDLARVLMAISKQGRSGFYEGWVAQKMVDAVQQAGGILSMDDLKNYHPVEREPLNGRYHGLTIVSMPPPSSGGGVILQLLGYMDLASQSGLLSQGFGSAESVQILAHAMSLAFADRATYYGDPAFVKIPVNKLLSSTYLKKRWHETFSPLHATQIKRSGITGPTDGTNTTSFAVIDRDGNAVAITTTINNSFGSGFMPPDTGVMMNDEMDDFSIKPNEPNLFDLVGGGANAIAPGKKPLSSMSPTIVLDKTGSVRLVIGAMGGPRIITSVFQALFNHLYYGMSLVDAVAAARVHQQWEPASLNLEPFGFSPEVEAKLRAMGYQLTSDNVGSEVHAIERFVDHRVLGVSDFRSEGEAVAE